MKEQRRLAGDSTQDAGAAPALTTIGTGSTSPLTIKIHGNLPTGWGLKESRQVDQRDIRHATDIAAINPLTFIVLAVEAQPGGLGHARAGACVVEFHSLLEARIGTPRHGK